MKPKHQRLIFVIFSVLFLCAAALLAMQAFRENIVYFYSPSEIAIRMTVPGEKIRLGGLVEQGTVRRHGDDVQFILGDGKEHIQVHYKGLLPNLFREGQGVIAEGTMISARDLEAETILAKHDENYMPKEVVDALKASGHWQYGNKP